MIRIYDIEDNHHIASSSDIKLLTLKGAQYTFQAPRYEIRVVRAAGTRIAALALRKGRRRRFVGAAASEGEAQRGSVR